jgi:hypothetical protein
MEDEQIAKMFRIQQKTIEELITVIKIYKEMFEAVAIKIDSMDGQSKSTPTGHEGTIH